MSSEERVGRILSSGEISLDHSIGAEEAQEIIEEWFNLEKDMREYLGKDCYFLDSPRLRNAFFAGLNYAERYDSMKNQK